MGQPVAVVEKPSSTRGIVRFEANRTLTGQGHERFTAVDQAVGPRPAAELARRLFASGRVAGVHIYANVITIDLAKGCDATGLHAVVRDLHKYWMPGMEPPPFDEPEPEAASGDGGGDGGGGDGGGGDGGGGDGGGGGGGGGGGTELSEAAKRVPPDLLERSRLARERWKAKHG